MKETQTEFKDIESSFSGNGKDSVSHNETATTGNLNTFHVFEFNEKQSKLFEDAKQLFNNAK